MESGKFYCSDRTGVEVMYELDNKEISQIPNIMSSIRSSHLMSDRGLCEAAACRGN